MRIAKTLLAAALTVATFAPSASASAATICLYDPAGKSGDYYRLVSDFALDTASWGTTIEVKAYTDEQTATKDYEAGACDGVVATGVRLQRFNNFPSTIEAIGAVPSYDVLRGMVRTLATSDGAAKKLRSGEHETVGIIPVGAAYLFVRDRNVDSVPELGGLRIATMDYDKAAPVMVDRVGAVMVGADLGSIGPKFNNGDVDACYMSAPGYKPFELEKGLNNGKTKGGILRAPLAQGTLQLMIRHGSFPADFGKRARGWFADHFDVALAHVLKAESEIPASAWIDVPPARVAEWDDMFLGVRLKLRDDVGAYDGQMLTVLRQMRCQADGARAECAEKKE